MDGQQRQSVQCMKPQRNSLNENFAGFISVSSGERTSGCMFRRWLFPPFLQHCNFISCFTLLETFSTTEDTPASSSVEPRASLDVAVVQLKHLKTKKSICVSTLFLALQPLFMCQLCRQSVFIVKDQSLKWQSHGYMLLVLDGIKWTAGTRVDAFTVSAKWRDESKTSIRENLVLPFPFAFQATKDLSPRKEHIFVQIFFPFLFEGIMTTVSALSKDSRRFCVLF